MVSSRRWSPVRRQRINECQISFNIGIFIVGGADTGLVSSTSSVYECLV